MESTSELTEKYLSEHPSIRDCLKKGVINYSKLARKIARDLEIEKKTSMEAILISCRRYEEKLKGNVHEENIRKILRESELEIKNKIVIAIAGKNIYSESLLEIEKMVWRSSDTFYVLEGSRSFTLIFSEKYLDIIEKEFGRDLIKTTKGLAMIILKSPEAIETTPGVVSAIYSIFGEYGINISQTMSCWTDTIFVISEGDVAKVLKYIRF